MLKRFKVTAPIDAITSAFQADGAVIVENFLSPDVLARLNRDLDPHLAVAVHKGFVNEGLASFFGDHTRNVHGLVNKSDVYVEEILPHPIYMGVAQRVLGPHCAAILLNSDGVFDRGPGSDAQSLHRDDTTWTMYGPPLFEYQISSMVALSEYTEENGATLVVPGSNHWPRDREAAPEEMVPAEMDPGSVVFYLGSTLHCAGSNRTADNWRRGMHVSYCLGWLRTTENYFLTTDADRVRKMPTQSQNLLGFAVHDSLHLNGGYLGALGMRDPQELLRKGEL